MYEQHKLYISELKTIIMSAPNLDFADSEYYPDDFDSSKLIAGGELEDGTSLENYMKESDLIPPLKIVDDDEMQFFPSIEHTSSIVYDDDFDNDVEFDMLSIQVEKVKYSLKHKKKHIE